MSPFGPLIPPQPRVYFRNEPLNDALPTAHYPLPTFLRPLFSYSYELFVVPKEVKPFTIKQIRTLAQNTGGVRVLLLGPFTSHRSRATSHVLSVACSLFVVSLRSFLHSFSLFSRACSLFSQNAGVGRPPIPLVDAGVWRPPSPWRMPGCGIRRSPWWTPGVGGPSALSAAQRYHSLSLSRVFVFRLSFRFSLRRGKMEPLNPGTKP